MKYKYSLLALSLCAFAACTPVEDIYDEIDAEGQEIVKKAEEYVLTDADYDAISKAALKNAKTKADSTLAKAVKSELALNEFVQAADYVPAILAKNYYSWGNGSSVGVTYRSRAELTDLEKKYAGTDYAKLTEADYEEYVKQPYGCFAPSHPAKTELPKYLKKKYADAADGAMVLVDYREAAEEPQSVGTETFAEDFEKVQKEETIELDGWEQVKKGGDRTWIGKDFNNNKYAQFSAYKFEGVCDTWLVSPKQTVVAGQTFLFDLKYGNYKGDCLQVLISDKYTGNGTIDESDWINILNDMSGYADIEKPAKGYANDFKTLRYTLDKYAGKNVYIAFRYTGEGPSTKTTTAQVDNVKISSLKLQKDDKQFNVLYTCKNQEWSVVNDNKLVVVTPENYKAMGGNIGKYGNFSNADQPATYLPVLLSQLYPYAQEGDVMMTVYRVNKIDGAVSTQFNFTEGQWVVNDAFTTKVQQTFIKNAGVWKFDPTITVEHSKEDMQYLVDWVKENKPNYLNPKDHPENTEYLFGASSYYNNFNITLNKRRGYDPENLLDKEDNKATEQLLAQVAEGCRLILAKNYPDAATTMNGLELYYVVKAHCYNGTDIYYNFRFKSLGKGNFEWDKKPVLVK